MDALSSLCMIGLPIIMVVILQLVTAWAQSRNDAPTMPTPSRWKDD